MFDMDRNMRFTALSLIVLLIVASAPASAQAPGFADITRPQSGEALVGVVTIEGSAAHPAFVAYELSFAYDPNPTDTWFPIVDYFQTSVTDGRLGLWDTTSISDGEYQIRLRVILSNDSSLEAYAHGLRVRNTTPTETVPAIQEASTATPAAVQASVTPTSTDVPVSRLQGGQTLDMLQSLKTGAVLGALLLLLFAMYAAVRRFRRSRHAALRLRKSASTREESRNPGERNSR